MTVSIENEEYVLGKDVTGYASGKKPKDSVVVSVRLSMDDFSRLEKICAETDLSISQVVRKALSAYAVPERGEGQAFRVNMQTSEGIALAVGPVEHSEAPSISWTALAPKKDQAAEGARE